MDIYDPQSKNKPILNEKTERVRKEVVNIKNYQGHISFIIKIPIIITIKTLKRPVSTIVLAICINWFCSEKELYLSIALRDLIAIL